jgi:coenzyme PQQ precursor peptide PqqA
VLSAEAVRSFEAARIAHTTSRRGACSHSVVNLWKFELTELRRRLRLPTVVNNPVEGTAMKWKTPVVIEIAVGLEINAYACAEVK